MMMMMMIPTLSPLNFSTPYLPQVFIVSVTHLVKVKSEAHKLKNKVIEANKIIQDRGM